MCTFITSVAPIAPERHDFRSLVEAYGLLFEPIDNPHIAPQLRPGERYFHVTQASCDCSTELGTRATRTTASEVDRLRRRGWGEAKIQRWVQSRESRHQRDVPLRPGELTRERWAAFLEDALALPKVPYLGLLTHFYGRSTDDELFLIRERVSALPSLVGDGGEWADDVLFEFRLTPNAGA